MKILSLFDGISVARVALERAGLKVDKYYASEIDKYAIQIASKNYPDTIQLGDVKNISRDSVVGKIDLLIGGSPCQDLSIAKTNRQGLSGSRSGLFFEYVRILKELKPRWFVLENVASMPKEAKQTITETLGVEPIMIDAALVSAQNRKRLFWTNIPNIAQPEDRGIFLKDILESGVVDREKSRAIASSIGRTTHREYFHKQQGQMVYENPAIFQRPRGKNKGGIVGNGKSPTLTSSSFEQNNMVVDEKYYLSKSTLESLRNWNNAQAGRIRGIGGKSVTLQAGGGGTGAKTGLYVVPFLHKETGAVLDRVRKLTPIECERLQSLPDDYTDGVSNSQRYKALGNAFNCEVISHILRSINDI